MECGLRIDCPESRSRVEILRCSDASYSWFELHCTVDIGHGRFSGSNVDIQFLNVGAFMDAIDRFAHDRSLTAQLDGTYGSFLIFWCPGGSDDVMLSFSVGDAYSLGPVTSEYNLTGSFRLPQGVLGAMIADFRVLLTAPAAACA